ncbi:cupin domain-containing protein [Nocardioides sp.]|uniref:cupin domain-containing protein n=1 Tax=Nocardioides sp. TaxID=35761 RepID=UPI002B274D74|nr:cupin domain-containing protein [Nocardioides sp.]
MRIHRLDDVPRRRIEAHDSIGFDLGALGVTADAALVVVRVAAGGRIGRHPAAGRQLLVLLTGDARVAGYDGMPVDLAPGEAAEWEPGEAHETRTVGGLTALVIEGDVDLAAPGHHVDPGDV